MAIADPWNFILEWWQEYQPHPYSDAENIESGLKKQQTSAETVPQDHDPAVKGSLQTAACQYWIKGLPSVCSHWKGGSMTCGFEPEEGGLFPTGYGVGGCDGLGRRHWCSEYGGGDYDPNLYACVLPCIERSGAGKVKRVNDLTGEYIEIIPWKPSEIVGYNPDGANVGQCDGQGMGRGKDGLAQEFIENLQLYPPICKQYKPHMMGFGAVDPRPYHGTPPSSVWKDGQTYIPRTPRQLHDGSEADPLVMMQKRLPFAFTVYNLRSQFQKCGHWDSDIGGTFFFDDYGPDPSYFSIETRHEASEYCKKAQSGDGLVLPFVTIGETTKVPYVLWDVWSEAESVVCNGAKPECPCYTGRWTFCTDRNMQDGMRISADQIFELRFWASNWSSQDEYDRFYEAKPGITQEGFADITTADIYTFTNWDKLDATNPSESIMLGNKHHMCMPAPLHMREYDPEAYVIVDPIIYPKAGAYGGTTGTSEAAYPTLVRELEDPDFLLPDILVIYPYSTPSPWNDYPCNQEAQLDVCFHNNNLMYDDPKIMTVGACIRNKKVWVINNSYDKNNSYGGVFSTMETYSRAQKIPNDAYEDFCRDLEDVINSRMALGGLDIVEGFTDEYGFFKLDYLILANNTLNDLYIICEWETGDFPSYVYRHRKVQTTYFGALISQDTFAHAYEGNVWTNPVPDYFSPSGPIDGEVGAVGGEVGAVFSCYSLYKHGIMQDVAYYAYCINRHTELSLEIDEWVQIGTTGYIWAEVPDIDISYLWDFKVTQALISAKPTEEYDEITNPNPTYRASLCGFEGDGHNDASLFLEVVEIDESIRKTFPPSALILKSPDGPRDFFNKDWSLKLSYYYEKLEPELGEDPVFPTGPLTSYSLNRFTHSPYNVEWGAGSSSFSIPAIGGIGKTATAAVMAYVVDPIEGRVQAAAATKMLLQGHRHTCRSVDIFYRYKGDGQAFDLEPAHGFFTWRGSPGVAESSKAGVIHARKAKCGDHECNPANCIGPMWFPFNSCTATDFYNVHNGAGQCTMPITEGKDHLKVMGFAAWRYCMAEEYKGWVTEGGNWASACGSAFYFHYSHALPGTMQFTGPAKRKGKVDAFFYSLMQWTLPPFGNTGRAMVERYIIRDFASFYDLSQGAPKPKLEYMPMVLDREDMMSELDCFKNPGMSSHPNLSEPFSHRSMLSNMLANYIKEEMVQGRFRFEDIVEPEYHGDCMYPWPVLEGGGGSSRVIRYKFKNDLLAWIWPEYWKRLERNIDASGRFNWLTIERPEYYYDSNKARFRLITDEGPHIVMFKPPETQDESDEAEDTPEDEGAGTYGAVSLDGAHWRYFEMVYDDYDDSQVDWMDESVVGDVGGSGGDGEEGEEGEEEGSIYETANNGKDLNGVGGDNDIQWIHDYDTIFDASASAKIDDNRKVLIGDGLNGYFNRGLVFRIPKSQLGTLPIEETSYGAGELIEGDFSFGQLTTETVTFQWEAPEGSFTKIEITGGWGTTGNVSENSIDLISQTGVEFGESFDEIGEEEVSLPFPGSIYAQSARSGRLVSPLSDTFEAYSLNIKLVRTPQRMIKKPTYCQLKLFPAGGESIEIDSIEVWTGKYIAAEESIIVWEQKFLASTLELDPEVANADGTDTKQYRDRDRGRKNAGQYLPVEDETLWAQGGNSISKMAMSGATKFYGIGEDESIEVSRGNLKTVERDEQKFLYEETSGLDDYDSLTFQGHLPPDVSYFLSKVLGGYASAGNINPSGCTLTHMKIPWENNYHQNRLNQEGDFFVPGGHYFKWSDRFFRTRCYIFGPVETVYSTVWMHHLHGGGAEQTPTAGESYAGWVRIAYYEGRLAQMFSLGQSEVGQPTDGLTGAKNATVKR
jgi:hypothetical protein